MLMILFVFLTMNRKLCHFSISLILNIPTSKFTFEKQNDGKLSFLDILIDNSSRDCVFSVFHKKTYTGLLTNFFQFYSVPL